MFDNVQKKIHNLSLWDFVLVKVAVGVMGIIIGAYLSPFILDRIWYFAAVFVIAYGIVIYHIFGKEQQASGVIKAMPKEEKSIRKEGSNLQKGSKNRHLKK